MTGKQCAVAAVAAFGFLLGGAGAAYGQACIGLPLPQGSHGVHGTVGFMSGATTFGGSYVNNPDGPLGFGVGYRLTSFDGDGPDQHGVVGNVNYGFALGDTPILACAVSGLSFDRMSEKDNGAEMTRSLIGIPVGASFGYPIEASPTLTLIPFATPQLLIMRSSFEVSGTGIFDGSSSDTNTEFAIRAGSGFAFGNLFGGAELFQIFATGADAQVLVNVGLRF